MPRVGFNSSKTVDILGSSNYKVKVTEEEIVKARNVLASPPGDRMIFFEETWILQRLEFDEEGNSLQKMLEKYPWLKVVCFYSLLFKTFKIDFRQSSWLRSPCSVEEI